MAEYIQELKGNYGEFVQYVEESVMSKSMTVHLESKRKTTVSYTHLDVYKRQDKGCSFPIALLNSGNLANDFYKYAEDFFNAAESVIHYLCEEAAEREDIAKLDLWYFAMVYMYRQSIELLLKARCV